MTFIAVDATFSLLEVDGIVRQVPMHDRVAVEVESSPSCPTEVVASTNGQNGELKAKSERLATLVGAVFGPGVAEPGAAKRPRMLAPRSSRHGRTAT